MTTNTPTLSGRAEPGSTVNIIDNGQVIGSTKVNPDGTWSFTPDQALSNGEHDLDHHRHRSVGQHRAGRVARGHHR
ncbi:Ig-like domain-containing protein [Enterobacter cloacae complex sp. 4DZ3-17B2]|uniref:Ig-like domain-containing protein n=1 Tax=Enterobacter cloacae complex sp. 4DZ3-17B2 TaxID=2511990 RepID=UPI0010104AD6|nr:Ig-like domain-containing protein [Enterobacter cloacae complex sp. 4DZ3-17B2]